LNYNTLVQEARSKTQVLIFEPSLYINLFKIHWSRYSDMAMLFDRHPKFLCQVFLGMNVWISERWGDKVKSFDQSWTTGRNWLENYAAATESKGSPVTGLVGWVDGTYIQVARPARQQRAHYCGHRGCHCFKVQVIAYPCGLITSFGPFLGPTHDAAAVTCLRLNDLMVESCFFEGNTCTPCPVHGNNIFFQIAPLSCTWTKLMECTRP